MISQEITSAPSLQAALPASENILGKDDFLRLLVTQLRHQDPLNPMKSEEFAAQLAQFSSVEQLHNINSNLNNSIETDMLLNQSINNIMATTLIGKSAQAVGNSVALTDDGPVQMHYKLASEAENVTLTIHDSQGRVVKTVELHAQADGTHSFQWNGKDDDGNRLAAGDYTFSVDATDINGNSVPADTLIVGVITGVRYENGTAILSIDGREVRMGDIFSVGDFPGQSNEKEWNEGQLTKNTK